MKKKILPLLLGLLSLNACNYLDVVPEGTPTLDDIFSSSLQTERFLYTVYGYIPNYSSPNWMPDMCAGGDLITGTNGQTRYFRYKSVLYGEENPNNTHYGLMTAAGTAPGAVNTYDLYKGIRYAWTIISHIDNVPNLTQAERNSLVGESYFLVGFFHWVLMQYYGPIILVEEELSINAPEDEIMRARSTWDECAAFVSEMFDKAADLLPATRPDSQLGRATSVAAKGYKARVLMYTASPFVNGNDRLASFRNYDGSAMFAAEYDKEKWKAALDATKEAIVLAEANGYKLYEHAASANLPDAQRGRDNYYNCFIQQWNKDEYLFAFGDTADDLQRISAPRQWNQEKGDRYITDGFRNYLTPTLQLVETYLTVDGLPLWADPKTKDAYNAQGVAGLLSYGADEIADLHKNRDPRFYATVGYDRGTYEYNDSEVVLRLRSGEHHGYTGNVTHEYNGCTGYLMQKYVSKSLTYDPVNKAITYAKFSVPYLRLAELYLDYAEADFEYDGRLDADGLMYLNRVRNRAGLPDFETSWAKAGGMPTGENLRQALHQENMSELACEWRWYHNLRRWDVIEDMMGENPDVLNVDGKTAAEFYTIAKMKESGIRVFSYPKTNWLSIPLSEIEINYRLVQNPGY